MMHMTRKYDILNLVNLGLKILLLPSCYAGHGVIYHMILPEEKYVHFMTSLIISNVWKVQRFNHMVGGARGVPTDLRRWKPLRK